jgi:2-succinyl-5-enolpyruvyl-6-hydroxy-3-cyclohexene-1-carboxylate synthase
LSASFDPGPSADLASWLAADACVRRALAIPGWSEARALSQVLRRDDVLHVASSLPIRHLESHVDAAVCPETVMCNRGVNGIDGTLSTALGAALGLGKTLTVVVGDLAFAHDLGGLAAAAERQADLAVVVIDNGGGGIFRRLPIADHAQAFEGYFETPRNVAAEGLCRGLGLPCWVAQNHQELTTFVEPWRAASGVRVLVVKVGHEDDHAWRAEVLDAVKKSLGEGG